MSIAGMLATAGLAGAAAIHAVWAFTPWPAPDRATLARIVLGSEDDDVPWLPACLGMAGVLAGAAYVVAAKADVVPAVGPDPLYTAGAWAIAGGLLLRGTAFPAVMAWRDDDSTEFRSWDLKVFAPICIVLGGLSLVVALSGQG
ncbi:MAG TPA: DUF3995 domain-containing protein [Jiangellaceae bacterium]